jgi:hypothetical protein
LDAFRDGSPEDQALINAIGLDRDGLERAWREDVGAAPMQVTPITGPTPTRTPYPTLAPITGPMTQPSETPAIQETATIESPTITATPALVEPSETPLSGTSLILIIGGVGGACMLVVIGLILWRRVSH